MIIKEKKLTSWETNTLHVNLKKLNRSLNLAFAASRGICQVFKSLIGSRSGLVDLHKVK